MRDPLSKLAWMASRPGPSGSDAHQVLQDALSEAFPLELEAAKAKARRKAKKHGEVFFVQFAPTMLRAVLRARERSNAELLAWYRRQMWPFSVTAYPYRSRQTVVVVWSTKWSADTSDWSRRKARAFGKW